MVSPYAGSTTSIVANIAGTAQSQAWIGCGSSPLTTFLFGATRAWNVF